MYVISTQNNLFINNMMNKDKNKFIDDLHQYAEKNESKYDIIICPFCSTVKKEVEIINKESYIIKHCLNVYHVFCYQPNFIKL